MAGESDDLDKLFESVADGESVDWDALERSAPDEESRALIRQLRLIAEVAEVHRSQVDEVALTEDASLTTPPRGLAVFQSNLRADVESCQISVPRLEGELRPAAASGWTAATRPNFGVWGHLLLVRKIGEGSYGEVFHAHDTWLDHPVALKLLKPEAESRVQPSTFSTRRADWPACATTTSSGCTGQTVITDGSVSGWISSMVKPWLQRVSKGRLSAGEASSVGLELCRALAAVHRASIIHRDVKAQNVMRAHDGGGIILMDFGAGEFQGNALATRPQGTPLYMAPELFESSAASVRTDIYAAGVLLFHLVTNAFPVNGGSMQELREAHARGERRRLRDERPDLPIRSSAIVERAHRSEPDATLRDRGRHGGEAFRRAVDAACSRSGAAAEPGSDRVDLRETRRRNFGGTDPYSWASSVSRPRVYSRSFLRIDPDFYLGSGPVFTLGFQALFPFIAIWVSSATVVAVMAGIRLLLPTSLKHPFHRLGAGIRTLNPAGVATAILLVGSAVALALLVALLGCVCRTVGAPARPESSLYVDEDSRTCQSSDT